MTTPMRARLNRIKQVAGARDDEYCARAWLKNVFYKLVHEAMIDGNLFVTVAEYGPTYIRDEEIKLLKEMGYTVAQHTRYAIEGGSTTTTTISWKNE